MDWFLMKENGDTFWTQCESREQALADAQLWNAELIRQATIVETRYLEEEEEVMLAHNSTSFKPRRRNNEIRN